MVFGLCYDIAHQMRGATKQAIPNSAYIDVRV